MCPGPGSTQQSELDSGYCTVLIDRVPHFECQFESIMWMKNQNSHTPHRSPTPHPTAGTEKTELIDTAMDIFFLSKMLDIIINVLFAGCFVGSLYMTPEHIRKLSHNNPIQINSGQSPPSSLAASAVSSSAFGAVLPLPPPLPDPALFPSTNSSDCVRVVSCKPLFSRCCSP